MGSLAGSVRNAGSNLPSGGDIWSWRGCDYARKTAGGQELHIFWGNNHTNFVANIVKYSVARLVERVTAALLSQEGPEDSFAGCCV
ncbi:hypothetical protein Pr1d_08370 [Bythopirellula goksoeyrii]|uniref:Uncharacterized protein n=1 Tax=Bythopirellula goksoeyrii TaxID=1400387 RepID=A0A5B9QHB3_9BACT|nr:hypothetical protein Pr1d_08370 [Bythopirellula goksoeyrii]